MTTQSEVKVRDYPHLRKVDSAFIVNADIVEYHRALARRKQERASKDLSNRVGNLEKQLAQIIELLTAKEK